jgi:uncharacterized membrane protein
MNSRRLDTLDAVRGLAMVWMTVFHFCFDLNNAGVIQQNFLQDPVWTWQRTAILSLFLCCAGAGQALAHARGQSGWQFARRWLQIAAAAALVSLGSWFMFPGSYIYFGVLHAMAVMLLITRLVAPLGLGCGLLGLAIIATHFIAGSAISIWAGAQFGVDMNGRGLNWIGWVTRLPRTEDYVPLFPWLGVMLLGFAFMQGWQSQPRTGRLPLPAALTRRLAALGQWSLSYYLLHQPVLLGLLWLAGIGR